MGRIQPSNQTETSSEVGSKEGQAMSDAMSGHNGTGGLQNHSMGDLYPMTVRVILKDEDFFCQAFHCITGWEGSRFHAGNGSDNAAWSKAHRQAEAECEVELGWRR